MSMPAGGVAAALGAVALSLTVIGCGNDDRAQGESRATTTAPATTTTQPPATDTEAVRPVIEELVQDYDIVLAKVVVDPGQVNDPASPVHDELAALFTPAELQARIATFRENAGVGRVYQPIDGRPLRSSVLLGEVVADGDDALQVTICTTYYYLRTGPEGDGQWKIARVDQGDRQVCDPAAAEVEG